MGLLNVVVCWALVKYFYLFPYSVPYLFRISIYSSFYFVSGRSHGGQVVWLSQSSLQICRLINLLISYKNQRDLLQNNHPFVMLGNSLLYCIFRKKILSKDWRIRHLMKFVSLRSRPQTTIQCTFRKSSVLATHWTAASLPS